MKKIWPWLLLLLILIILCLWTKIDSIHHNASTKIQTVAKEKTYIDYSITQKDDQYILNGNFKNLEQQASMIGTCSTSNKTLEKKDTSTNTNLIGDESITLTNKILPHFIANYRNGKIVYQKQTLLITGDVSTEKVKDEMQRLLKDSVVHTQDHSNVVLPSPINFTISKKDTLLQLSGTFRDENQINTLAQHLPPSYSTMNVKHDSLRTDAGAISLAEKILPHFVKYYQNGKITYAQGKLTIEGIVDTEMAISKMNALLKDANIPVINLTKIDPLALKRAEEAKNAEAKKVAALAEEEAKRKAQREAEKIALEREEEAKRKLQAQALLEHEAKLLQAKKDEITRAKEAVKVEITKLLQLDNIEFKVSKASLTKEGDATVDKLANILIQYPNIKVEIAGHTDSDGSAQFNQKLSQARVDAVKDRLVLKGISSTRLTAKGYGESKPLVPNTNNTNKQKNRRVEINIQGE